MNRPLPSPLVLSLGASRVALLPDGRVLVTPPASTLPFGAQVSVTVLYPSLRAFLIATTKFRRTSTTKG